MSTRDGHGSSTSLSSLLDGWFETSLTKLPDDLQQVVNEMYMPITWEMIDAAGRRNLAAQIDAEIVPQLIEESEFWFNLAACNMDLQAEISAIRASQGGGETQLRKINELETEERRLRLVYRRPDIGHLLARPTQNIQVMEGLIPFSEAGRLLTDRFDATLNELAAWMVFGDSPLPGYLKVQDVTQCSRLILPRVFSSFDLEDALIASWFVQADLVNFVPDERYISGAELLDRWNPYFSRHAAAFIVAKVAELRLTDLHPIAGISQATVPHEPMLPALEEAVFRLSEVESIEAEQRIDVQVSSKSGTAKVHTDEWRTETARKAINHRHDKPGGARDKRSQIREIWASGKYTTRDICAEQECAGLDMSFSTARKALRNTPQPTQST